MDRKILPKKWSKQNSSILNNLTRNYINSRMQQKNTITRKIIPKLPDFHFQTYCFAYIYFFTHVSRYKYVTFSKTTQIFPPVFIFHTTTFVKKEGKYGTANNITETAALFPPFFAFASSWQFGGRFNPFQERSTYTCLLLALHVSFSPAFRKKYLGHKLSLISCHATPTFTKMHNRHRHLHPYLLPHYQQQSSRNHFRKNLTAFSLLLRFFLLPSSLLTCVTFFIFSS